MFRITKGFSAREAAAYNLDEALGLGVVPETSLIESGGKWYSLQNWVDNATLGEDVGRGLLLADQEDAGRVQLLDMIMGNADRHERNWLLTADGRLVAIDNGLSVVRDASAGSYFESHNFARFKNVSAFLDAHKDRLMLSSAYRTKLQKLWKSGELEKILRIATDVNSRVSGPALLQAAMLRASWILDNWDDYFVF